MNSQLSNSNDAVARFSRWLLFAAMGSAAIALSYIAAGTAHARPALAAEFTEAERQQLEAGGQVHRRFDMPHHGRKYLGALSYSGIQRSCEDTLKLLMNPTVHYARALPATRAVRFARKGDKSQLVVEHGNWLMHGSYTVHWLPTPAEGTVRFWLDHSKPRDVQDVFGYFRVFPLSKSKCLLSVGVAVDPGQGLLASMFRGMIHSYLVKPARRIRNYVQRTVPAVSAAIEIRSGEKRARRIATN